MSLSITQPSSIPVQLAQRFLLQIDAEQTSALAMAVFFHLLVATLLFSHWQQTPLPEPKVKTVKVQMLAKPLPAQPAPPTVQPPPPPQPAVKPVESPPAISEAKFAKKRVDEEKKPEQLKVTEQPKPVEQAEPISPSIDKAEPKRIAEKSEAPKSNESASEAKPSAESASASVAANHFDVSQYAPVSKEAPAYPQRALDKGVQGKCTVEYTVNTQGLVEDAQVLSDCHPLFIKSSLEATKTFRYSPRFVDGKPVKVTNVKNTFQYRIE